MSSRHEVFIRILALLQRKNWNEKSHIKMLKTATFDCVINEKCCSVDGGRGICPLFSSPSRGIWQLKSPHPRESAIQGKKILITGGHPRGGGGAGRSWNRLMHNISMPNRVLTAANIETSDLISKWGHFRRCSIEGDLGQIAGGIPCSQCVSYLLQNPVWLGFDDQLGISVIHSMYFLQNHRLAVCLAWEAGGESQTL